MGASDGREWPLPGCKGCGGRGTESIASSPPPPPPEGITTSARAATRITLTRECVSSPFQRSLSGRFRLMEEGRQL